jgi:hypothetical protein
LVRALIAELVTDVTQLRSDAKVFDVSVVKVD